MAAAFDPERTVSQCDINLLCSFLKQCSEVDLSSADLLGVSTPKHFFIVVERMPARRRVEVEVVLRQIHDIAGRNNLTAVIEEVQSHPVEEQKQFDRLKSSQSKALWLYLKSPSRFQEVAMFVHADALAQQQYWHKATGLPTCAVKIDDALKESLGERLAAHFRKTQLRGRYCVVNHLHRQGIEYFFAYLDDYAETHLIYPEDARLPEPLHARMAFQIVFSLEPQKGVLEIWSHGGAQLLTDLHGIFCETVYHKQIRYREVARPTYALDHLLQDSQPLKFNPAHGVQRARIRRVRIRTRGRSGYIELSADSRDHDLSIIRAYQKLQEVGLCGVRSRVARVTFELKFAPGFKRRARTMSFDVSSPNGCTLKSKPDEDREIGEWCLREWGVSQ
ncbi:MAG: hypothetical protein NCW75_11655 [Phycisphaera sp.]|nr:MAG: hypothetical protein NCW75_11655 [Phycisphaera sp.]